MGTLSEHLEKRMGNQVEYLSYFLDKKEELLTVLLWSLDHKLVGYQRYNWKGEKKARNNAKGKYWTYTTSGTMGIFGLEQLDITKPFYVTEGIFDAMSIMNTGRQAIAVLANNPKPLRKWLKSLNSTAVCDGDKAGRMLGKNTTYSIVLPEGEDANSMPLEELDKILTCFEAENGL